MMALMSPRDRALFTAAELALIDSSSRSEMKSLGPSRLRSHITRTRKYWDKYRDLARQQHRTKKEAIKGGTHALAGVRTERKARVFAEVLSRFEKRLEQLERQIERQNRKKTPSRAEPSRIDARQTAQQHETIRRRKQRRQAASESARESSITRQFQKSKMRAIHGHIRAGGKRRQAKRDAR
jgi:Mg2+ and Co2+ transporter CorA